MTLFFTKHALDRLKERGISKKQVQDVWDNPDVRLMSATGTTKLQKRTRTKTVTVVVEEKGKHAIVITAY